LDRTPVPRRTNCRQTIRREKIREESLPHRRRHYIQSRLDDRTNMTSELAIFKRSEDEEATNIVRSLSRPSGHKDRHRSKDRRETRTSSEDSSRRHTTRKLVSTGPKYKLRQMDRLRRYYGPEVTDSFKEQVKKGRLIIANQSDKFRMEICKRRRNAITYKDSYSLPLIDNCLNALVGWFSNSVAFGLL